MAVERVDVEESGSPWHEEHLSRYVYATDFFKNNRVLDIACGTVFGSLYISKQNPAFLYCADVSEDAITATKLKLSAASINVEVGFQDGTKTSFEDNSFDTIISIETIEHIDKDLDFLKEMNRILAPGGTLILSTPNGLVTNPSQGIPENKFHVREDFPKDFQLKLNRFFSIEKALGQHVVSSYGPAPFLPSFSKELMSVSEKLYATLWSVLLRFPNGARNAIFKAWRGHNFYPAVEDYTFLEEDIDRAHVQYYILKKR